MSAQPPLTGCIVCGKPTAALCDFVLEDGTTCDAQTCEEHRNIIAAAFVDPLVTAFPTPKVRPGKHARGYVRRYDACPEHVGEPLERFR